MSIIDSFSLEYRLNRKKIKRTSAILSKNYRAKIIEYKSSNNNTLNNNNNINNINGLLRNKTTISGKIISVQVLDKLTSLGYKIDSIMALAKQNKFSTVEEALDLLEKDSETNLYTVEDIIKPSKSIILSAFLGIYNQKIIFSKIF